MLVSAVPTSEEDKRVSGGEVIRCEVTIGYQVLHWIAVLLILLLQWLYSKVP